MTLFYISSFSFDISYVSFAIMLLWIAADPPLGEDEWKAPEDGFAYAVDLVRFIRKTYGNYFVIAVGGQSSTVLTCFMLLCLHYRLVH